MATNYDIVPAANRGERKHTSTHNFSTEPLKYPNWHRGHMPPIASESMGIVARERGADQIIYSYSTPIAVRIGGMWIIPDVTYSVTTSAKHATHLWSLTGPSARVPWDISPDELRRVIDSHMRYVSPRNNGGIGSWVAAS